MKFCLSSLSLLIALNFGSFAQTRWQPAKAPLKTPWTDKVSAANALPEYPRPQMARNKWLSLNGEWSFALKKKNGKIIKDGIILVPYPVESSLSGIKQAVTPEQVMAYNRQFVIPRDWPKDQRILLHFGAVDYQTSVFVNGKKAGDHIGGYAPFSFDITDLLNKGEKQLLTVQVIDPTDTGGQPIGKQRLKPKGIYYTPTSGIWQSVWLEPVPKTYIKSFRVEPDIDKKRIVVRVETAGDNRRSASVTARVMVDGQKISEAKGKSGTPLLLQIRKDLRLWSLDDPYLYDLEISLGNKNSDDKVQGYFGMRKISIGKDAAGVNKLMLNDQPVFQIGVLDQGYWPDGLYTPPTEAAMQYDLQMMKDMGFNLIRKHVKVEPARWYHLCDKMGLLVWQDMPSATNETESDQNQFKYELKAMIDHLFNFPSVVMWVPFNEAWGQHNTEFYVDRIKTWDPTRLVNNASGWTDTGVGDVLDIHAYPGPAAPAKEEGRAIVLGEFGGLGLNVRGHKWTNEGWGYQLIETPEALLKEYEKLWSKLYELQDTAGLGAVVYTQLSDIETENNGLLTYDRQIPKIEPSLVKAIHQGYLPPKPKKDTRIFIKRTTVELTTIVPGADISYSLDGHAADAKWLPYNGPVPIKRTSHLRCRATWPDGHKSHIQDYHFTKTKPVRSKVPKGAPPGVSIKMYEGAMEAIPDFSALTPVGHWTGNSIDLSKVEKEQHYALLFETFVEIPVTGVYTFHVASDDGSRLHVANQLLIDNDGVHGMRPMDQSMALKAGKHPLRLAFFQNEGGEGLEFWVKGPDGQKLEIGQ